ncbi:MAG: SEC-C metal-binding domain-containing protein [Acidobacteriota bacterium]
MRGSMSHLLLRLVGLLIGLLLTLPAVVDLRAGEPDFLNWYGQRVSTHMALAIGIAIAIGSLAPWPKRGSGRSRGLWRRKTEVLVQHRAAPGLPGRNAPCHCGSGKKYKLCCLRADQANQQAASLDRFSAALNRSQHVSSATEMVNRGLRS